MKFIISNCIILSDIKNPHVLEGLKHYFTLSNPAYEKKIRYKQRTYGVPPKLLFYHQINKNTLLLPRGAAKQINTFLNNENVKKYEKVFYQDKRRLFPDVKITFAGQLRAIQATAVKQVMAKDHGMLWAGTGAGKTIMALYIMAERKQPALIVVHTKELLKQWIERIQNFLGIPENEIGVIGDNKARTGKRVTIAIINTLKNNIDAVKKTIGHLIVDECHRLPAIQYRKTVSEFDCKYLLGLSATPWRNDGLTKVIFWYMGGVVAKIEKTELLKKGSLCEAEVKFIPTNLKPTVNVQLQYAVALSEIAASLERNRLICNKIVEKTKSNGRGVTLVLSDRKDHCHEICRILITMHKQLQLFPVVMTGETNLKHRTLIVQKLRKGDFNVLIATGQLIGEGFDLPEISTVFLTTPLNFDGRLIQYIGRALRPAKDKDKAIIYDFIDYHPVFFCFSDKKKINLQ